MCVNFHDSDCTTGETMFNTAKAILDRQLKYGVELVNNKRFVKWVFEGFASANPTTISEDGKQTPVKTPAFSE